MAKETKAKKKQEKPVAPQPEKLPGTKMRTFSAVTTAGNKCVMNVQEAEDLETKLIVLKDGLSAAIKDLISITFERAEINDLITNEPSFQHLQFYDPSSVFSADADSLQVAQIMSMISNLQQTVTNMVSKQSKPVDEKLIQRLEKVFFEVFYKSKST